MKKQISAILIGAGDRGMDKYAPYAFSRPNEIRFVAVAEPDKCRREQFGKLHKIAQDMLFESWEQILEQPKIADAALICTQDRMHYEPTIRALDKKYHVLLEKPMSPVPSECISMVECAENNDRILSICHVLRYTPFFSTLKQLIDSGRIGRLISIQHNENVAFWHQAHSFVRGNWRNSSESSPMILAKCCHDMDILYWLTGSECRNISSFGELTYFTAANAPKGSPKRCQDGCPIEDECLFYAPRFYLKEQVGLPAFMISSVKTPEEREKALHESSYGRCVYHCDNDVVDHQVASMEFENGVTASFTMCAFTNECNRTIKCMGTKGEIRGFMEKNELEVTDFLTGRKDIILLKSPETGHGGGDYGIMHDFVKLLRCGDGNNALTSAERSVHGHLMAFAAEESRVKHKVVNITEFKNQILNR